VRVIQRGDRARLAVEALAELRVSSQRLGQHLDRDRAIEPRVARSVDLVHTASTQGRLDFVRAEARTGSKHHFFSPTVQC